jgi:WD40 repeat protein
LKAGPKWDNTWGDMLSGLGTLYAVAPGRTHVVVGGRDGSLRLLDARSGNLLRTMKICSSPICSVALAADEQFALVGTWKGGVKLVSLSSGEKIALPSEHHDRVRAVAFLGGDLVASGSADRTVHFWRLRETPEQWMTIQTGRVVRELSPSPDGTRLAVLLSGDRAVRIWNLDRLRNRFAELGLD